MKNKKKKVNPLLPTTFEGTADEWRKQKREEFRVLYYALSKFNFGAAYIPHDAYTALYDLQRAAEAIKEAMEKWE